MKILDVGCGHTKYPSSVGIDILEGSAADVIHDLNVFPWPFPDNEFDMIFVTHVLEHLKDVIRVMEELHRIGKPEGTIVIEVPHYTSYNMFTDPTHRHFFSARSFNYFIEGTPERTLKYTQKQYALKRRFLGRRRNQKNISWNRPIEGIFLKFINRLPGFYEKNMAFILPVQNIYMELIVIKEEQ